MNVLEILIVAMGIALPLQTLWRLRSAERRRDDQLSANAQPRLAVISHVMGALIGLGAVVGCAPAAIAGHPFFWAVACLGVGIFVSAIVSAAVVFRTPAARK
jgi:hypothetical protein